MNINYVSLDRKELNSFIEHQALHEWEFIGIGNVVWDWEFWEYEERMFARKIGWRYENSGRYHAALLFRREFNREKSIDDFFDGRESPILQQNSELVQQYAPYMKWFGTAFAQLNCAGKLTPILADVLRATSWQEREKHLSLMYGVVATIHNDLGVTDPLPTQVSSFHKRPFLVIHGDAFADAIRAVIVDEKVRALPDNLGAIDQFVDSTDVLSSPEQFSQIKSMYLGEM